MKKPLSYTFIEIRKNSEKICKPLVTEDYVVQPAADISPPKWHLGHTAWFFEVMLLKPHLPGYREYNPNFDYVFNSYYETLGARVIRTNRGNLSRPTVDEVYRYRKHVDAAMLRLISTNIPDAVAELIILGLNHEQQHQELLLTDIKYILGHNPLFPVYDPDYRALVSPETSDEWVRVPGGIYNIGFEGSGFSFDNEQRRHQVYLNDFEISTALVSNAEYLEFIDSGGYSNFKYWHASGWEWVKTGKRQAPLYWHLINGKWQHFTLAGLLPLDLTQPVAHVNYYESWAFANWKNMRLPTEAEWETAAAQFEWGMRWEWTESAYLPYPGMSQLPGPLGEYNRKFMVGQQVLKGASEATPLHHSRPTYRNFFPPESQWQFTGLRLVK